MDAVAYIDPAVISFVNDNLIPLRLEAADPVLGPRYKVKWTPTLLILNGEGVEQYRTLGFYPPDDLVPSLLLGMGKAKFDLPDRPAACDCFGKILADYPGSTLAAEAVYLNGVAASSKAMMSPISSASTTGWPPSIRHHPGSPVQLPTAC
ncbi:MAG: hypothetical protein WA003_01620 [Desulfuromonadaceae bacterium]